MRYDDQPCDWIVTTDPSLALMFGLPFLISSALGATFAALVTWLEVILVRRTHDMASLQEAAPRSAVISMSTRGFPRFRLAMNEVKTSAVRLPVEDARRHTHLPG